MNNNYSCLCRLHDLAAERHDLRRRIEELEFQREFGHRFPRTTARLHELVLEAEAIVHGLKVREGILLAEPNDRPPEGDGTMKRKPEKELEVRGHSHIELDTPPEPSEADRGIATCVSLALPRLWAIVWYLDPDDDPPKYEINRDLARDGFLYEYGRPHNPTSQCYIPAFNLTPRGRKAAHAIRDLIEPFRKRPQTGEKGP